MKCRHGNSGHMWGAQMIRDVKSNAGTRAIIAAVHRKMIREYRHGIKGRMLRHAAINAALEAASADLALQRQFRL